MSDTIVKKKKEQESEEKIKKLEKKLQTLEKQREQHLRRREIDVQRREQLIRARDHQNAAYVPTSVFQNTYRRPFRGGSFRGQRKGNPGRTWGQPRNNNQNYNWNY
ncbi:uncharacterized protein LOC122497783 [Leptopilina heterotoma]|uniref:uncharacterized protein LOC122497782 n=1 Tax=Leptopilina heterotoma TaxID=63436 RepID=UPI001CA9E0E9|nr:uncharacterized protein LOC122497782 [Leptopilina heterotoma]XP_043461007.1 uncharacterized protein LOC122497783 [Leptopilina heterotoma]